MDWPLIVNIAGSVGVPLALWVLSWSHRKIEDQKEQAAEREKINFKRYQEIQKAHERLTNDMHAFQLDVAQRYATAMALREAEQRFAAAVERFEYKLDRFMAAVASKGAAHE